MSEETMIRHCSPTLAGIKTGNLFTCSFLSKQELLDDIRHYNKTLGPRGLRILPLRYLDHRALIYLYRPARLRQDLQGRHAGRLLRSCGYACETPERCIVQLAKRLQSSSDFPHEIGLFLGYPPEDVQGFIDNHADRCKCMGCWKVYGDEEQAKKLFAKYKKCTDVYQAKWAGGRTIEQLTVAECRCCSNCQA